MKKAVVCGAGGFIGSRLVRKLKKAGYWVRGVDIKRPEFGRTAADEFFKLDLRLPRNCAKAVLVDNQPADEIYQLAADMGGMGFISVAECEVLHNNALINLRHGDKGTRRQGEGCSSSPHLLVSPSPPHLFSSSVCVYRDMQPGEPELTEDDAIPSNPDNEYGWEKLYAERMAMAYGRRGRQRETL